MEELLIGILRLAFEVIFEVLSYLPFEWPNQKPQIAFFDAKGTWFFLGAFIAWVSLFIFDASFLHTSTLRMLNLIIAPISSGYVSKLLAIYKKRHNPNIDPNQRFWRAFCFVLGIVIIRFIYAEHL